MKKFFCDRLEENGLIKVNEYLQLEGENNIFAAGDINNVKEEKTAQNAEKHAEIIASNIIMLENGKELSKYYSRKRPLVISLGKYSAIFEGKRIVFFGFIPAFLKFFIEWVIMRRYKRLFDK